MIFSKPGQSTDSIFSGQKDLNKVQNEGKSFLSKLGIEQADPQINLNAGIVNSHEKDILSTAGETTPKVFSDTAKKGDPSILQGISSLARSLFIKSGYGQSIAKTAGKIEDRGIFTAAKENVQEAAQRHLAKSPEEQAMVMAMGMTEPLADVSKIGLKVSQPIFSGFKDLSTKVLESKSAGKWLNDVVANHNPDNSYRLTKEMMDELAQYRPNEPITLYRGINSKGPLKTSRPGRNYESWTTDKEMAEFFANSGDGKPSVLTKVFNPDDIVVDFSKVPKEVFRDGLTPNFANREMEVIVKTSDSETKVAPRVFGGFQDLTTKDFYSKFGKAEIGSILKGAGAVATAGALPILGGAIQKSVDKIKSSSIFQPNTYTISNPKKESDISIHPKVWGVHGSSRYIKPKELGLTRDVLFGEVASGLSEEETKDEARKILGTAVNRMFKKNRSLTTILTERNQYQAYGEKLKNGKPSQYELSRTENLDDLSLKKRKWVDEVIEELKSGKLKNLTKGKESYHHDEKTGRFLLDDRKY